MEKLRLLHFRPNLDEALEVLDTLRADLEAGKITGFLAVGVADDDECLAYTGFAKRVSGLRAMGAVAYLQHLTLHEDG